MAWRRRPRAYERGILTKKVVDTSSGAARRLGCSGLEESCMAKASRAYERGIGREKSLYGGTAVGEYFVERERHHAYERGTGSGGRGFG
ncbi:hypothetical protein DPMN_004244 [Dreissena polymorpha]|uniref:Uncharacterized protein n=1 Tax=Dreissena polymorpha TaxID=45954 RepID=A0A9D4MRF6_DREPO|nr:hypothetical protein DPMN_004244 [Dreissena polymorpha]